MKLYTMKDIADLDKKLDQLGISIENWNLIEKWAIALALGNNGGEWAKHYKDEHKEFWRKFAKELLEDFNNNRDPRSTESPKRV